MWNFLQRLNASPICLHFVQLPCLGAGQSSERTGADTRSQRENGSARSAGVRTNFDVASRKCLQNLREETPDSWNSCHTRPDSDTATPSIHVVAEDDASAAPVPPARVSSVSELTFPAAKLELVPGVSLGLHLGAAAAASRPEQA
ncbi:unnamed protein product [Pleuronectes platessa]|uniref:Uncharacterized protein n=1 Tax=Pleuronectes platessa TaxID=8262 RepID=A0A9N7W078_PLEPL|nr:unnamed protein product [Pleuronectes platessa]